MDPCILAMIIIIVLFTLVFLFSACRLCSEYDKRDEQLFEDWLKDRIDAALKEQKKKEAEK